MAADLNALPLLLTISESFTGAERGASLEGRLVHAAVHGWMEGHLASPSHRLDPDNVGEMPDPPFPHPDDPQLGQIVAEASRRFREGEEPAAVAFAAALGWQAGRATAVECPGCAPTGHDEPAARAMREGRGDVRFVLGS
ncbi:MAG: hypothetical protein ACRDLM_03975 [Gaiellaceae bacterium]